MGLMLMDLFRSPRSWRQTGNVWHRKGRKNRLESVYVTDLGFSREDGMNGEVYVPFQTPGSLHCFRIQVCVGNEELVIADFIHRQESKGGCIPPFNTIHNVLDGHKG